jgi:hypothetical protein
MDPILQARRNPLAAEQQHLRPRRAGTLVLVEEGLVLEGPPRWLWKARTPADRVAWAAMCLKRMADWTPRGAPERVLAGRPADENLGICW